MPNYIKSGTFVNGSAPGITASFLNAIENAFVQPAGGTETRGYYLTAQTSANGQSMGTWVPTLSQGTTPLSVSINTSVTAPTFCVSPSTDHITQYGFHVFSTSVGVSSSVAMNVGGTYTVQY